MDNRMSTSSVASDRSKRWSMPSLQPLEFDPNSLNAGGTTKAARRSSRGSVSGTAFGKTDFGVPLAPIPQASSAERKTPIADRRASRRISRVSKLSDVSEVESVRTRSTAMSAVGSEFGDSHSRRRSRRMSLADNLIANEERRRSRRHSSVSAAMQDRFSLMEKTFNWQQRHNEAPGRKKDIPWEEDARRPANWRYSKKIVNTAIASAIAFTLMLTLSMYAAATPLQEKLLGQSQLISTIPYSAFILGLALGPAAATPLEMAYGRKPVTIVSLGLFALVMIGAGVARGVIGLAVARFLAALFASPALFLTHTNMQEMWVAPRDSIPVATYVSSGVLGLAAGPIVGGVVLSYISWRWTEFIAVFLAIIVLFACINMGESQEAALKRSCMTKVEKHEEELKRREANLPEPKSRLHFNGNMMIAHSFRMLAQSPSLIMISLWMAITFGMMTVVPIWAPGALAHAYHFSYRARGLTFIGAAFGAVLGFGALHLISRFVMAKRLENWKDASNPVEAGPVGVHTIGKAHASWRRGLAPARRNTTQRLSTSSLNPVRSGSEASQVSNKRGSAYSNTSHRSRHMAFSEKNINVAIAVTRFLNAQPGNADRKIIVERVMVLLKNTDSFTVICASLHELGLEFDDSLLAKTVTVALGKETSESISLSRSRSLNRLTAQAALMGGEDDDTDATRSASTSAAMAALTGMGPDPGANAAQQAAAAPTPPPTERRNSTAQLNLHFGPPPELRLVPSLPGSLLLPVGIIVFAWTCEASLTPIVPAICLGAVYLGAALSLFSGTAYLLDLHGEDACRDALAARAAALLLSSVVGAALPLVAGPMAAALGVAVSGTVFGAVCLAAAAVPWVVALRGGKVKSGAADAMDAGSEDGAIVEEVIVVGGRIGEK